LIQQTQYTPATPKYNFPPTLQDATLPQRLIELSIQTLKNTQNHTPTLYQPYTDTETEPSQTETTEEITPTFLGQTSLQPKPIQLKPDPTPTTVLAIDVSSISLGETETGTLIAIRGAIVWKNGAQYRYLRIGPFPFHITEENKNQVYRLLRQHSFFHQQTPNNSANSGAPSLNHIAARMGTLLERWLQTITAKTSQNTLILWDGSLTAGTTDAPVQTITQLLETARNHNNTVLAFTKLTRLRLNGHRLTDLTTACHPPYLLPIDGYPGATTPHNTIHFLGNIYVAKLSQGNCSFRLDIDQKTRQHHAMEAAQRLVGNDLLAESYPETLRLAHIHSTFTANEVLAIQRLLTQTHRLRLVQRPNIRRLLFGPFGKGPEGG